MSDRQERSKGSQESLEKSARRPRGSRTRQVNQRRKQVARQSQSSPPLEPTSTKAARTNSLSQDLPTEKDSLAGEQHPAQIQSETTSSEDCNTKRAPTETPIETEQSDQVSSGSGGDGCIVNKSLAGSDSQQQSDRSQAPPVCAKCIPIAHQETNLPLGILDECSTTQTNSTDANHSVNAVRVLFKDQNLEQVPSGHACRAANSQVATVDSNASAATPNQQQPSISVVSASRRLIERQIEAIQVADSHRWNFDFRNCRPLNAPGHRYTHFRDLASQPARMSSADTLQSCRPLSDQTLSTTNRFNNQARWRSPSRRADLRHHRLSDHKQEDD